jgi:hypothetical protein
MITDTTSRCITYALQSIDKTTLSYAAVFGLVSVTSLLLLDCSLLTLCNPGR